MSEESSFSCLSEFCPCYPEEHSNPTCHRLHYVACPIAGWVMPKDILTGRIRF
ncbi:Mpo1-like protein [Marinobacter sp.]|uniref:Mpo1-like protein n=1 Tax=Marinobacter sp. TaxID=50741 RepID=UPI00384E2B55